MSYQIEKIGNSFFDVGSLGNKGEIYLIPCSSFEDHHKKASKVLTDLIQEDRIETLLVDGFEYEGKPLLKKQYDKTFVEGIFTLTGATPIPVYGTSDKEISRRAIELRQIHLIHSILENTQIVGGYLSEESKNEMQRKFGSRLRYYSGKLDDLESDHSCQSISEEVELMNRERETVFFDAFDEIIAQGYRKIAVYWGKNHIPTFTDHFSQKNYSVYTACQENFPELSPDSIPDYTLIPYKVRGIFKLVKELRDYWEKTMNQMKVEDNMGEADKKRSHH